VVVGRKREEEEKGKLSSIEKGRRNTSITIIQKRKELGKRGKEKKECLSPWGKGLSLSTTQLPILK